MPKSKIVTQIKKRDGRIVAFKEEKVANAIFKAAKSVGGRNKKLARELAHKVTKLLNHQFDGHTIPSVEQVQDLVEKVLIEEGHAKTAKAYILYRDQHARLRELRKFIDSDKLIEGYLSQIDWRVKENSNMTFSLQGLNNHVASAVSSHYWLHKIYPPEVRNAHLNRDFHIHDLQLLSAYCTGWDLKDLMLRGFGGVSGKLESKPPKHLRTALGQIVNFFYTVQGEIAGAVAFSNFDTYLAPFIRYDHLKPKDIRQCLQEFLFNMNVPTRVGFQCISEDTEILGKDGWKKYNQVKVGDTIATFNVEKGFIEYLSVKNVFAKKYKGKMYNLKNTETDQLISPRHRVVRKNLDSKGYVLERIEKILDLESAFQIPIFKEDISENDVKSERWKDTTINEVKEIDYKGTIWCPNTKNETVIARRKGKVFITGNTPFTNITLDLTVPKPMQEEPVIIGGKFQKETYGNFQKEIDLFNKAFGEVMLEGDAKGRVFSFPIPTINITSDFDWRKPEWKPLWEITAKYGVPYFANFVNSDMKPDDVRSMCCRLRLNNRELRKRGGGLFGANPLTGSIGVVTINMPRLGFLSRDKKEFFQRLKKAMDLARLSLQVKREILEKFTEEGLYPYCRHYLDKIQESFGEYWRNHFNTIGLLGMNEGCLNLLGTTIASQQGQKFTLETLQFMRERLMDYQNEEDQLYNLEATPGEGTSYNFARHDKERFPNIIVANEKEYQKGAEPYYTNSTHLPVGFTDDFFEALDRQDDLQILYTGGTVIHGFIGERMPNITAVKKMVKTISYKYHLPYFTITPTFSICPKHGYIAGEHEYCPKCDAEIGYVKSNKR